MDYRSELQSPGQVTVRGYYFRDRIVSSDTFLVNGDCYASPKADG
jgi:hypothetical protein